MSLGRAPGGAALARDIPARSPRTGHRVGVTWRHLVLAAWVLLAASLPAYAVAANRDLERIPFNFGFLFVVACILTLMGNDRRPGILLHNALAMLMIKLLAL
jgi:hypothetical protein